MAKTASFDVTKNLSGLTSLKEINVESIREEKKVERSKPEPTKKPEKESNDIKSSIFAGIEKREKKTVHKNFLWPEELATKFSEKAKELNVTENTLITEILKKVL